MRKILTYLIGLLLLVALPACRSTKPTRYGCDGKKPKYLWFDAEANFERFASKDSICYYLDKAKEVGFNRIVVDVKPVESNALFKSNLIAPLIQLKDQKVERDWDYLQFFIDEAHKRNLGVTVSATIFPVGLQEFKQGPAYTDSKLDGRTCIEYTPQGMVDLKNDTTQVGVFLNPALPENQEYALSFIREILTQYNFEGFALDYCRYPGAMSDFSDYSRKAFESYIGEEIESWPTDVFSYDKAGNRVPGKYYQRWWEYRAKVIHDMIARIRSEVKTIKPDVELEYWAASWIYAIYVNGQNWGSKRFDMSKIPGNDWATPEYSQYGFADQLDAFMLGTYLERVYGLNDPESIEYGIDRAKKVIDGDCKLYGTIYAKNHSNETADAVYVSLHQTEGLMVFDIIQVIEGNLWEQIREGIARAEKEDNQN